MLNKIDFKEIRYSVPPSSFPRVINFINLLIIKKKGKFFLDHHCHQFSPFVTSCQVWSNFRYCGQRCGPKKNYPKKNYVNQVKILSVIIKLLSNLYPYSIIESFLGVRTLKSRHSPYSKIGLYSMRSPI